jgi:DNA-binding FadR family transcriptional regulator
MSPARKSRIRRFRPIRREPAYRQVAEAIEREIISGRFRPGEPLGTEASLVEQFGVNRSTVREGIRLLEHGGLLKRDRSRRLLVGLPYEGLASRISRALVLSQITFWEAYEAALTLQLATIDLAAQRVTPELLRELEDNVAEMESAGADVRLIAELDARFHFLLGKCAGNRVLQLAREPTELLIIPTTAFILARVKEGRPRLVVAHREIIGALRRRDREAAREWIRRHMEDWRKGFLRTGNELDRPIDWSDLQAG